MPRAIEQIRKVRKAWDEGDYDALLELLGKSSDVEMCIRDRPQCAFEANSFKFLIAHLRHYRSRCLIVRLRHIRGAILLRRLRTNQRILPAAAAHESMRPVRMKMRVHLAVETGDLVEIEQQP